MRSENWQAEMDAAAEAAKAELDNLLKEMSTEELKGAGLIINWLDKHTATAGYKRLCRLLRANK